MFVGRIGRPHGVAGEMYLDRTALTSQELMQVGVFEWRGRGDARRELRLREARDTHDRLLVTFAGVTRRDAAAELTNGELWVEAGKLPDPGPGVVYAFQLLGCVVVGADGREYGEIRDVVDMAGRQFYEVGESRTLIPAHAPFLERVDLEARRVHVTLPAGFDAPE